jgi:secreted trypsin-like serine protease
MVSTVTHYTDARNRANTGEGFDGVVRVVVGSFYGTGVLLYDGRAVLTAAHLFTNNGTDANVHFETTAGSQSVRSNTVTVQPNYDARQGNNDLAVVWLSGSAPVAAERYNLYRSNDEIGQTFTTVGYGVPGTGATGTFSNYTGSPIRQKASNQFEADAASLKATLGSGMSWTPTAGTQLIADFDNGTVTQDALGQLLNLPGTGLGQKEGLITPGDSGGPAFVNGQISGIASYTATLENGSVHPDIDNTRNSSFGEVSAWQRVSHYQQWIDQTLRSQYLNAPTKPEQVQKFASEGNIGTQYAYFLLQFTGVRSDPNQLLSVDYSTRDGTATGGMDYLAVHGKLIIYPNENQALIPVEIIGDTLPEPDETFYMDVTNPVGGSFGVGVVTLTAVKIIVNDDGIFGV